ncbi:MAG: hypothetical protein A2142_03505 [candidate division Zixibacteria bacterium RBG_16_48_11]|nr:MAG: hypothetical protein A2142_03505 [candidate division Zixibacteria bacterium RBG_16_48_11]
MTDNYLIQQVENLVSSARSRDEILLDICHYLQKTIPKYTWIGFYLVNGEELVLGPYVGKPSPHTRIKFDSGICGAAVRERETIVVDDVNSDPRYLACSLETKSEMVVPIWKEGKIVGEIDIDSDELAAFNENDKSVLEQIANVLSLLF